MMGITILVASLAVISQVSGHGMLFDPPGRSSMWRFGYNTPVNYDDDAVYCGGIGVQWDENGGKCGVCGDPYTDPHPQENENGGKYGRGIITGTYQKGSVITVTIHLETAHLGNFEFQLCNLDGMNIETEECFKPLMYSDGSDKYPIRTEGDEDKDYKLQLQLPNDVTCKQCVLRWHYMAGNNWGECDDGTEGMGCGPQETFRNCADITINA